MRKVLLKRKGREQERKWKPAERKREGEGRKWEEQRGGVGRENEWSQCYMTKKSCEMLKAKDKTIKYKT